MRGIAVVVVAVVAQVLGTVIQTASAQTSDQQLNGFTIGMPREKALTRLKTGGAKLVKVETRDDDNGRFERFAVPSSDNGGENVGFCAGLLSSYTIELKGGASAFIRQAAKETELRGKARYDVASEETPAGQSNHFTLSWPGEFKLTLARLGDYAEQVWMGIRDPNPCR